MKKTETFLLLCGAALLCTSCLGIAADITIRADGSGKISLEYRVSQMLESLGRLDGNEGWPAIPVGRADFERSLSRIPGIRMSFFSSQEKPNALGGRDLVTNVTLEFANAAALLAFLDNSGTHAAVTQENGKSVLRLAIMDASAGMFGDDILSLMAAVSAGYEVSISFTAPKSAALTIKPQYVHITRMVSQGAKVSFAIGMGELLALKEGLALEITW